MLTGVGGRLLALELLYLEVRPQWSLMYGAFRCLLSMERVVSLHLSRVEGSSNVCVFKTFHPTLPVTSARYDRPCRDQISHSTCSDIEFSTSVLCDTIARRSPRSTSAYMLNLSDHNPASSAQTAAHPNLASAPPKKPDNVIACPPAYAVAPQFVRCDRGIESSNRARASRFDKL